MNPISIHFEKLAPAMRFSVVAVAGLAVWILAGGDNPVQAECGDYVIMAGHHDQNTQARSELETRVSSFSSMRKSGAHRGNLMDSGSFAVPRIGSEGFSSFGRLWRLARRQRQQCLNGECRPVESIKDPLPGLVLRDIETAPVRSQQGRLSFDGTEGCYPRFSKLG